MFFDPFEPLINVLILPANSLALFLVQKLRERQIGANEEVSLQIFASHLFLTSSSDRPPN